MSKIRSPWTKPTTIMVICFLLIFIGVLAYEAKAETLVEGTYGATFVGGERYNSETVIFSESFHDDKTGLFRRLGM